MKKHVACIAGGSGITPCLQVRWAKAGVGAGGNSELFVMTVWVMLAVVVVVGTLCG
jgi:hypothetical protein